MIKLYLLTMGDIYYPSRGSEDWIDTFSSLEEARDSITEIANPHNKTETAYMYIPTGEIYYWYEIINLNKWIYK